MRPRTSSRGTRLVATWSALIAALALGCAAEPPRTVRLIANPLDGDPPAEQPEANSGTATLATTRLRTRPAAGANGSRLQPWGLEDRLAVSASPSREILFPVELPRGATLRIGLGHGPSEGRRQLRYRAVVANAAGESTVLDRHVQASSSGAWIDATVDLGRWAGSGATLKFRVDASPGPPPVLGWGSPEISGPTEDGWSVLLISLDTLRADRLGCYGYPRPTSPFLDRLAKRSALFLAAFSQAPWTRPSHRSLLTGRYPAGGDSPGATTLATALWRAGYRTRALTGGGQLHPRFGFHEGFDEYRVERWIGEPEKTARWIARHDGRRQFLFLHTYEIHDPYTHPELAVGLPRGRLGSSFSFWDYRRLGRKLTADERAYVGALYDGDIAHTDRQLEKLFATLERRGLLDRTIVIVTSDHGEELWDHGGFRHGRTVYDHQLHVPLLIRLPGALERALGDAPVGGRRIRQSVQLIDLYPTILDLLGLEQPGALDGRSLLPLVVGRPLPARDALAGSTMGPNERVTIRTPAFKLIETRYSRRRAIRRELYSTELDPGEIANVADLLPDVTSALSGRLQALWNRDESTRAVETDLPVDPELRRQLKALGYVAD